MAVVDTPPLRRRVARLSWLSVALIALTICLLLLAGWIALRANPHDIIGQLPLGANDNVPSASLIVAAGALAATFFVGLAALNAAASMRVLARDRRIPPPLSREMRRLRSLVLTPLGPAAVRLVNGARPSREQVARWRGGLGAAITTDGAGAGPRRGPHHRGHAGVSVGPDEAAGQGCGRGRQLHRRHCRDRAPPRSGGLHHGRQHREEGGCPEPGSRADARRRSRRTTWSWSWTRTRSSSPSFSRPRPDGWRPTPI